MKEKIYLLLFSLCLALTVTAQDELIISNFEDISPLFDSWETKGVDVVENPMAAGINTTDSAIRVFTSDLVTYEGIKTYPEPLDFSELNVFSILVYSEIEGQVLLKLEGDGVSPFEQRLNYTEEGSWQELRFDLSGATSNVDTLVALFPDIDGTSDSTAWYFDEIKLTADPVVIDPVVTGENPITFETEGADYKWIVFDNPPEPEDNDSNAFSIVDNPDPSGINTSAKVGKYEMHVGAAMWAGVKTTNLNPIIITEDNKWISMDIYKTDRDSVGLKIEPPSTNGILVTVVPETFGEWETVSFDFSEAVGDTFPTFVIFPDWTGLERSEEVIYFDNIRWSATEPVINAVKGNSINSGLDVYPNPASESINIISGEAVITELKMFNIIGNTVFSTNPNQGKCCINVSSFDKGLYILSVTTDSGNISSTKVIIR
jgi:hypothetical protein